MRYYVVDAFTDALFKGNPAGVCVADAPLADGLMQQIAFENNLAETAFLTREAEGYALRWFTPKVEIDLCGHATLASAYIVMNRLEEGCEKVSFRTKSGLLSVRRDGDVYTMDFPRRAPVPCAVPDGLCEALGVRVLETHRSRDLLVLVESEAAVANLAPDFHKLAQIRDPFAFIVTARGETRDFVSRFFAPNAGIDEDPVTGSSHTSLIPFWSARLGKSVMTAAQLSQRGGVLYCRDGETRVEIGGGAVCYLAGKLCL